MPEWVPDSHPTSAMASLDISPPSSPDTISSATASFPPTTTLPPAAMPRPPRGNAPTPPHVRRQVQLQEPRPPPSYEDANRAASNTPIAPGPSPAELSPAGPLPAQFAGTVHQSPRQQQQQPQPPVPPRSAGGASGVGTSGVGTSGVGTSGVGTSGVGTSDSASGDAGNSGVISRSTPSTSSSSTTNKSTVFPGRSSESKASSPPPPPLSASTTPGSAASGGSSNEARRKSAPPAPNPASSSTLSGGGGGGGGAHRSRTFPQAAAAPKAFAADAKPVSSQLPPPPPQAVGGAKPQPKVTLPPSARKVAASPARPTSATARGTPGKRSRKPKTPRADGTTTPTAGVDGSVSGDGGGGGGSGGADEQAPPAPLRAKNLRKLIKPDPLARRILEVGVLEAAGLFGTDRGGVSNPKAEVFLVDLAGRVLQSEGMRSTPVKTATVSPVWNFKTSFGQRVNLSSSSGGNLPTLRVQVYSHQRFATENKPLGMVDVPLVNLSVDGAEWSNWYSLEPFGALRAGNRLGNLHLHLKIGPIVDSRQMSSRIFADITRGLNDRGDEEEGFEEQPPNFLRVTLHKAVELMAADLNTGSSDPLAILRIGGKEQRSTTIPTNLNPIWEETFDFEVSNSGDSLEITIEDEDQFVNDFLGFVSILMGDLEDKTRMKQWFDLKRKTGDLAPGEARGAIEITTQWFFNPKIAPKVKPKRRQTWLSTHSASDTEEDEPTNPQDPNAQLLPGEDIDQEEMKRKEEAATALLNELRDFKVVSGDYVAYVHVIEARDLKAKDLQGTSDPVVHVEAFGKKFATEVVKDRLNAVFDETFVINLRNMDQDVFKEGVFRVAVMDADITIGRFGSLRSELIGAVSFDATYVYFNKDHEIHRRWVALVDDENPEDAAVRGYLHLSIAIVGPDDRLKIHDEEKDRRREREAESLAGGLDSLVVMPPTIELQSKWLVTTVGKAEYLPVMDTNLVGGAGGGDFFFQLEVAGGKPIRTKKITIQGERHRLNPEWRTELWQPVTTPCMSGNIKYSVWDWDAVGQNELTAVFYSKLRDIEASMENGVATKWVNLYGPPLVVPESRNLRRLTKKAATLGLTTDIDYMKQYLEYPQHASTYRGRVLIMERVVDLPPKKREKEKSAFRRKIKVPPVPAATQYALRAFVGFGTEIPKFADVASFGGSKKMWLRISIGRYDVATVPVENKDGVCEWSQSLELKTNFMLPASADQVPDLIIHLMVGTGANAQACSFRRFCAKELIDQQFGGTPEWIRLTEDKVLDLLEEHEFPGSVLVRLGLGTMATYHVHRGKWKDEIQGLLKREPYELRVHLYQARNLPAADSNGLMDPYLKIKFKGKEVNTEKEKDDKGRFHMRRRETVDPVWYRTLQIKASLPPKQYQKYFPQVTIQLFDWDFNWTDDYAGNLFLNLQDVEIIDADRRTKSLPEPKTPTWEPFYMEEPGDGQGELLVSVQLIHTTSENLPEPESIVPKTTSAYLDMVVLGIRNLQPYQYLPMQLPYCVFEVDDMDGTKRTVTTEASNKPTGRDANFLQHIKMQLKLPEDIIYAPRVKVRVYDTRLGGFSIPLVGSGRIELGKKLPWGSEYEPPLAKTFAKNGLLRAITAHGTDEYEPGAAMPGALANGGSDAPRAGSTRSRSSARGGGLQFSSFGGSDDEEFEEDQEGFNQEDIASRFGALGRSGFARSGVGFGTPTRRARSTESSRPGSAGRPSHKVFNVNSSTPARSRNGGAMDVLQESSWTAPANNTPILAASGEVVDTGIGAIPALDLARQKAGVPTRASSPMAVGGAGFSATGDGGAGADSDVGAISVGAGGVELQRMSSRAGSSGREGEAIERMWAGDFDFSETPPYMIDRAVLENESLEEELGSTPFETYDIVRGQTLGMVGGGSGDLRVVGKLKCIVRVTEVEPDDDPLFVDKRNFENLEDAKERNKAIMSELLKPRSYKVRLYVLEARNLTAMDIGIGGRPGKSDPYLRVKLGKENTFDDQANHIDDVTDARIHKCVELNCELPGASQLEIDIMDYNDIGPNEVIGSTTIDLEDRWFDTRWQAWGLPNRCEDLAHMRYQTKPLETRTLRVPTSTGRQGDLRCWVDILTPEDAKAFLPDDVSLPPPYEYEVRVVFWKCKDVVAMDWALDQNDLFVKSWVQGCDPQETDTHWFAKKGKGSFNWRMKFKVSLGPETQAWKFPYLTVQLWDRDLFKYNDHIAEGQLDLGPYFHRAYKMRDTVKLFPKMDPKLEKKRDELRTELGNMEIDGERFENAPDERLIAADIETGPAEYDPVLHGMGPESTVYNQMAARADTGDEGQSPEVRGSPVIDRASTAGSVGEGRSGRVGPPVRKVKLKKEKGCCEGCIQSCFFCCCPCAKDVPGEDLRPGEDPEEEAEADAKALINHIKNLTGLWDTDPEETYWLKMERTNFETKRKEQMGQVLMGVQIWPIEKAEQHPAGNGRNEPNSDPFLPPPSGRLRFSLNPFVMGSELFGPKICCRIACVCCIVLSIVIGVYFSGFFNLLFSIISSLW